MMNFLAIGLFASPGYSTRECLSHHRKDQVIWAHLAAALAKDKIFSSFVDYGPGIPAHDARRWPSTTSWIERELIILRHLQLQKIGAVEEMPTWPPEYPQARSSCSKTLPYASATSSAVVLRFEGLTTT
jgi:hypothetical protein